MRIIEQVRGRSFKVGLTQAELFKIQAGTMKLKYKGLRFCKNPFDVVLYMRLIEKIRPRAIIEIGTAEGGSAVWFRDQCRSLGLDTRIMTFDINPPSLLCEPDIFFGRIDAYMPEKTLRADLFTDIPHPWIVIDDSAHTYSAVLAVLRYFDGLVETGDYLVVEDGVVADLPESKYEQYEDGPNRAVAFFLSETGARYEIDTELCDYYGHNVTYCPNAWLRVA